MTSLDTPNVDCIAAAPDDILPAHHVLMNFSTAQGLRMDVRNIRDDIEHAHHDGDGPFPPFWPTSWVSRSLREKVMHSGHASSGLFLARANASSSVTTRDWFSRYKSELFFSGGASWPICLSSVGIMAQEPAKKYEGVACGGNLGKEPVEAMFGRVY